MENSLNEWFLEDFSYQYHVHVTFQPKICLVCMYSNSVSPSYFLPKVKGGHKHTLVVARLEKHGNASQFGSLGLRCVANTHRNRCFPLEIRQLDNISTFRGRLKQYNTSLTFLFTSLKIHTDRWIIAFSVCCLI